MTLSNTPPAGRWDARYRGSDAPFGTAPCTLLPEEAHRVPRGGEVLSLGEGDGRHALWLAAERDVAITAMDISEVALTRAARKAEAAGLRFEPVVADLTCQPLPGAAFDAALWFFLHLPKPDTAALLARAADALRPGGVLLGRAWHEHSPAGLTADDLRVAT